MSLIPGGKKGKVGKVAVTVGQNVGPDQVLAQVETGKGNKTIRAEAAGVITQVRCAEGDEIGGGQVLFELGAPADCPMVEAQGDGGEAEERKTGLLILGAGPGGYVAAIYAAKQGLDVTLVERGQLGGTCLNVGCIPTKALVKSAEVCRLLRDASSFGVETSGAVRPDMERIIRRKDEIRQKLVSGIGYLLEQNGVRVLAGDAVFLAADRVAVNGEKRTIVTAENIIVATGSQCSRINIPGIDLPVVMNSTQALSCATLPATITIVGGGVIGMEFAFLYRNLGVGVQVVESQDRLLPMLDREVSQAIREIAEKEGIRISTDSRVLKIQQTHDQQAVVTFTGEQGEQVVVSDKVLVAIGRSPCVDCLGVEKAGIRCDERSKAILVDSRMRTNVEHIYAIGDVTGILQLAHVASHQGMVAVDNILGKSVEMDYAAVPNVVFTSPEIAAVGLTQDKCAEAGIACSVSTVSYASNGKALTMNEPEGFVKLIQDNSTKKVVGGFILGADASVLISTLTLAIRNGLTAEQIERTIFAHPTTAELIHEAALGLGIGSIHQA